VSGETLNGARIVTQAQHYAILDLHLLIAGTAIIASGTGFNKRRTQCGRKWMTVTWFVAALFESGIQPIPFGQPYSDTLTVQTSGSYRLEMCVGWDKTKPLNYRIFSNAFTVR